jgi:hypothetical protein
MFDAVVFLGFGNAIRVKSEVLNNFGRTSDTDAPCDGAE